MIRISLRDAPHTVIVTVDAAAEDMTDLLEHARTGLELFGGYEGFLGGATHVSEDATRLVQYLQWSSEEAYRACLDDPAWDDVPSTAKFLASVHAGAARMDARAYRVVAVSGGHTRHPDPPDRPAAGY